MATDNLTNAHKISPNAGRFGPIMLAKTVDTGSDVKAQNDIDNIFDVLPGDVVLNVSCKVETIEASTLTFDVGDGGTVDGYMDGIDAESLGWSTSVLQAAAHTSNATLAAKAITGLITGYGIGKIYTATDTIDVKWLNAAAAAKVSFYATILRPRG